MGSHFSSSSPQISLQDKEISHSVADDPGYQPVVAQEKLPE